jgi:hypothetical protein
LRQLSRTARDDLLTRVKVLFGQEAARYASVREHIALLPDLPERLRIASASVAHAMPTMKVPNASSRSR